MAALIPTLGQVVGAARPLVSPRYAQAQQRLSAAAAAAQLQKFVRQQEAVFRDRASAQRKQTSQMVALQEADAAKRGPAPVELSGASGKKGSDRASMVARADKEVAWPKPPTLPKEPIGPLERDNPKYFPEISERNRHDTDKTIYNAWKQEMAAKDRWRQDIARMEADYNKQADAYNAEMKARQQAANVPQPQAPASEVEAQKRKTPSARKRPATLLAGDTGGYNPATGGNRLGGQMRSLLG